MQDSIMQDAREARFFIELFIILFVTLPPLVNSGNLPIIEHMPTLEHFYGSVKDIAMFDSW